MTALADGFEVGRLLAPRSIAVVGANERPGSYASQALINLEAIGFDGAVWGVNPNRSSVFGWPCVPSVADLPEAVDAVVVAIPAVGVPDVIEAAGARGCGGAVVFSAGFAEAPGGADLQRSLVEAAVRHRLPVCGPNCNGIVATHTRTALWGDALAPREPGAVALISQSGNVAVNALATRRGLRFHSVIASGNQAVLAASDFLSFLARGEDGVRAVALYLEDDGGPSLCDGLAACVEAGVRVAVLKVGTSRAGAAAAAAHSAALAGDQRIFRALVEEAGAAWAHDVHDLLELAKALAVPTRRRGADRRGVDRRGVGRRGVDGGVDAGADRGVDAGADRGVDAGHRAVTDRPDGIAIMTCSGGDSAQGADEAELCGLSLPALAPATCERLGALLPPAATVANPLDYTAMIWGERDALSALVTTLGSDPAVDRVLVFYDQPTGLTGPMEESWRAVRDGIIAGAASSPVPTIVSSTLPELLDDAAAWRFVQAGVPAVAGLRTGIRCVAALRAAAPEPERLREIARAAQRAAGGGVGAAGGGGGGAGVDDGGAGVRACTDAAGSEWLSEHDSKALLRATGLPVPHGRAVRSAEDACAAWLELGGPIALKLSGASVRHKSELGAVALRLSSADAVRTAYARIAALVDEHGGEVLAEEMAAPGVELLIAASTDGVVPSLILGLGGIWTEMLDDVAVVPLPATEARVEQALRSLRGAPLLEGARGSAPVDLAGAARIAVAVGELLLGASEPLELIELNPVIVGERGAIVADAAIRRARARVLLA